MWLFRNALHVADGGAPDTDHVFLDRGLGPGDANLGKLAHDSRRSPGRIRRRHLADELSDLPRDGQPAGLAAAAQSPHVFHDGER